MHNFLYIIVMVLVDIAAIYDPKRGSKKFFVTGGDIKAVIIFIILYISLPCIKNCNTFQLFSFKPQRL